MDSDDTPANPKKPTNWLGIIALSLIIIAGLFLIFPIMTRELYRDRVHLVTALTNGKQIGQALVDFDQDWGHFPDDETAILLREQGIEGTFTGQFSNPYFRQLVASGILTSEEVFFVAGFSSRAPDDLTAGDEAVAAGENGFSYLLRDRRSGLSSADFSQLPVIMTSVKYFDSQRLRFQRVKEQENRAVVIRLNNSAEAIKLDDTVEWLGLFPTDDKGERLDDYQLLPPNLP